MGFQIIQSRGAEDRAAAELCLLKNENAKRIRVESSLSSARVQEKNARAGEADGSKKKYIDAYYQNEATKEAKKAADLGMQQAMWGAIGSIASNVVGIVGNGGFNFDNALGSLGTAFQAFINVAGAYLAKLGVAEEAKLVGKLFGQMTDEAKEDDKNMKALDGNPVH